MADPFDDTLFILSVLLSYLGVPVVSSLDTRTLFGRALSTGTAGGGLCSMLVVPFCGGGDPTASGTSAIGGGAAFFLLGITGGAPPLCWGAGGLYSLTRTQLSLLLGTTLSCLRALLTRLGDTMAPGDRGPGLTADFFGGSWTGFRPTAGLTGLITLLGRCFWSKRPMSLLKSFTVAVEVGATSYMSSA